MSLICLAAAVLSLGALRQAPPETNTLGKTPKQVVGMGRQKWFDFYTNKLGTSTHAMADAERTFAVCLASLTGEKIAKLPAARQAELLQLRDLMRESATKAVVCGMAVTGGGSLWVNIEAGQMVDVEEVLADLVTMPVKPKTATQTAFWNKSAAARKIILENADSINEFAGDQGMKSDEVLANLTALNGDFSTAAALIKSWPSKQRGRVIHFFVDAVGLIDSEM